MARVEIAVCTMVLIKNFNFLPSPDHKLEKVVAFTVKPKSVPLLIKKRE